MKRSYRNTEVDTITFEDDGSLYQSPISKELTYRAWKLLLYFM
ncbi:hypothetical protein [Pedobacter sp. MC2016-14]|nr:hypothetical protein [Pedobacter sp. MC2016-14]